MRANDWVLLVGLFALTIYATVTLIDIATSTGPRCPGQEPPAFLGWCDDK